MSTPRRVVAVVPDLFFATRIAATAKAAGVPLELVPPARAATAADGATLVLIDLHAPGALESIAALRAASPSLAIVGFYSHVETKRRADALAAGATAALPRSQFTAKLADLLARGAAALAPDTPGESR